MADPTLAQLPARLRRARRLVRRAVLRRRRPLAAVLAGLTVWGVVSALAPPEPPTVVVPVATHDLAAGVRLTADDVAEARMPAGVAPDGLAGQPVGEVLAGPVTRGEPLTRTRLVGPDLTGGDPAVVALPIRLPDPGMVALLDVGDVVDLVVTGTDAGTDAGTDGSGAATVIATAVRVLALPDEGSGSSGVSAGGATSSGRLVVVGVPAHRAAAVSGAAVRGYMTFTWTVH